MTKLSLTDELNRQIKEELKGILEPNKTQEIMMQQKYGLMRPLLTEEELTICNGTADLPRSCVRYMFPVQRKVC